MPFAAIPICFRPKQKQIGDEIAAKRNYKPDYEALYSGVEISAEVLNVLKKSDRKMEYMECDLKTERPVKDEIGVVIGLLPSREDSFERLLDADIQFVPGSCAGRACRVGRSKRESFIAALTCRMKTSGLLEALFFNGGVRRSDRYNAAGRQQA